MAYRHGLQELSRTKSLLMLLARMQCNGTMLQVRPKSRGRQGLFLVDDRPGDFANARVDYLI